MDRESTSTALELTYVLYDAGSHVSFVFALVTLTPILLMASYAALAVVTRDILVIEMWAGQLACEGLNWIIKRVVREERPVDYLGSGYGFPSSHSQYMGYFSSFLMMHLFFRHRFTSSRNKLLDIMFRLLVYVILVSLALVVCYSRIHLSYHTTTQVLWGAGIGVGFGIFTYAILELVPKCYPESLIGRLRRGLLLHPIAIWIRIKDGWSVWEDGGREAEWQEWRKIGSDVVLHDASTSSTK
ncbi:PAP2-domain-containing [Pyrrhoderma noxium]|uniref:Dolichyldiphosphatase n=1 Tax=Pyrrhoderma noxium TaxID=2282107 RepID=A0A286UJZ2_9AGAM|nr:PAP2-domain-containing [Pyrrhoderma noxium]